MQHASSPTPLTLQISEQSHELTGHMPERSFVFCLLSYPPCACSISIPCERQHVMGQLELCPSECPGALRLGPGGCMALIVCCYNVLALVHSENFMLLVCSLICCSVYAMQRTAAGAIVLQEEPSLYQSPLSHQSVSSFGSPSPRPAAPTPTQVTPSTPPMGQQPPDSRNALLTSIAKGQFHLRKMSHSFEPKGTFLNGTYTFMV